MQQNKETPRFVNTSENPDHCHPCCQFVVAFATAYLKLTGELYKNAIVKGGERDILMLPFNEVRNRELESSIGISGKPENDKYVVMAAVTWYGNGLADASPEDEHKHQRNVSVTCQF
ncbi:hypothetical protein [Endozoicomonas sp. 2B-B]